MKKISYIVSMAIVIFIVGCGGSSGSNETSLQSNSVNIQAFNSAGDVEFEGTIILNSAGVSTKYISSGYDRNISGEFTLGTDNQVLNSKYTFIDTNTSEVEEFDDYAQFSYDGVGNLLSVVRVVDEYNTNYFYDVNNLLIRKESQENATHNVIDYYYYDAEDKLVTSEIDTDGDGNIDINSTFVYNEEGRLIEYSDDYIGFVYVGKNIYSYNEDGKVIKVEQDWDGDGDIDDVKSVTYESNKITIIYVTERDQTVFTYNSTYGEIFCYNIVQNIAYNSGYINIKFNEELEKLDYNLDR